MEERDIVPTYRVLTEPIYDIQFWFITLTWIEAMICAAVVVTSWGLYDLFGLSGMKLAGMEFDSGIGGLGTGVVSVVILSVLHNLRPEGSIEVYLFGWMKPTKYIGRTPDRKWKPSLRPHWKK
jgi:hypothetical protein